jgi:hypothetical protein
MGIGTISAVSSNYLGQTPFVGAITTANVASRWMSEYSMDLSQRKVSAAMITMGMNGNTYSRIVITSLECFDAAHWFVGSFHFVRNRDVVVEAGVCFVSTMRNDHDEQGQRGDEK